MSSDQFNTLYFKPQDVEQRKYIGRLSSEAKGLYGKEGFYSYFTITLKNLDNYRPEAMPKSWAWVVTTKGYHEFLDEYGKAIPHLAADKDGSAVVNTDPARPTYHQPLDRLIRNQLIRLSVDNRATDENDDVQLSNTLAEGAMLKQDSLYEISVEKLTDKTPLHEYGELVCKPHRRVQAWHPVLTRSPEKLLKFGHLTDPHISVRTATMAQNPAQVIADERAGVHYKPVGERVAHTFKSFKALIDAVKTDDADVLALTGDVIDYNRNLDPLSTKGKTSTAEVWGILNAIANVYKPDSGYRRGVDHLYFYSMLMYALREKQLPAYYVSGNHEGYQWPFGISPRAEENVGKLMATRKKKLQPGDKKFHYGAGMLNAVEPEEKAREALRKAEAALNKTKELKACAEQDPNSTDQLKESLAKQEEKEQADYDTALADYEKAAKERAEFHDKAIEDASAYHKKKANECIPADHNLTIYEACLAYGPTYGQLLPATKGYRYEQLDWIAWFYTPFMDLNVYPCCTDLYGEGAKQAITLLGWGTSEHLMPSEDSEVVIKFLGESWFGTRGFGLDQRGYGYLPYADTAISESQLQLLEAASHLKAKSWTVLSHFTIASYEDKVPATIAAKYSGFSPRNKDESSYFKVAGDASRAQYNVYNWGGCELNVKNYIDKYISTGAAPKEGQVNLHLAGHSHRSGIYTLSKNSFAKDVLWTECKVPNMVGDLNVLPGPGKGTSFVVGTTAGPMGKQALSGWHSGHQCWDSNGIGRALLDGWFTRPPSGLIVDPDDQNSRRFKYVVALGLTERNDLPRLSVMLDYREVMSIYEGKSKHRPIVLCHYYLGGGGNLDFNFTNGIAVKLSDEMKALNCLDLNNIKVWVFKAGAPQEVKIEGSDEPAAVNPAPAAKGGWEICKPMFEPKKWVGGSPAVKVPALVFSSEDAKTLRSAFPKQGETEVLCAFMEIPLTRPNHPIMPWTEVKFEDDSWMFPVRIARGVQGNEVVYRDPGELGEVPNWEFLEKHCGYPKRRDIVLTK